MVKDRMRGGVALASAAATAAALLIGVSVAMAQAPGGAERGGGGAGADHGAGGERGGAPAGRAAGAGAAPSARERGESNPSARLPKAGGEHNPSADRGAIHPDRANEGQPQGGRGHVVLSGEKRTRFQSAIRGHHAEALHGVDFHVGVGTIIPTRYRFYPLPPEIIELMPEYRGYDYIVVNDEIIILEPGTRRIVDIIEE